MTWVVMPRTTMKMMMMKTAAAIYPNTIYGARTMKMQLMTKRKKRIKNIRVRRRVHRRLAQILQVVAPVRVPPGHDRIREKNRVERELVERIVHVPGIAVIVHQIIHAQDLAVDLHRPIIKEIRPANIVAE